MKKRINWNFRNRAVWRKQMAEYGNALTDEEFRYWYESGSRGDPENADWQEIVDAQKRVRDAWKEAWREMG